MSKVKADAFLIPLESLRSLDSHSIWVHSTINHMITGGKDKGEKKLS